MTKSDIRGRVVPLNDSVGFFHTTSDEAPWYIQHQNRLRDEVLLSPVGYAYRTVHGIGGLMRPKKLTISTRKEDHRFK